MVDTGAEVAKLAGVSSATVSRVFSAPELVRAETRDKVRLAAEQIGYTPRRQRTTARTPQNPTTRTGSLGVVLPNLTNPFFSAIAKAVHARARQKGYTLVLADSDGHEPDELDLATEMADRVDGMLLLSARSPVSVIDKIAQYGPVVLANRTLSGLSSVIAPHAPGTIQALEHLRALGHRRCAYVDGGRDGP